MERYNIVTIVEQNRTAIGIEQLNEAGDVTYIGSIYIDEQLGYRASFRKAADYIRELTDGREVYVQTNAFHLRFKKDKDNISKQLGLQRLTVKVRRESRLGDTYDLAHDAIQRRSSIEEVLAGGSEAKEPGLTK